MGGGREAERERRRRQEATSDPGVEREPGVPPVPENRDGGSAPTPEVSPRERASRHEATDTDDDLVSRETVREREHLRFALGSLMLAVFFSLVAGTVQLYFPGQTTLLWENSALATLFYGATAYFRIRAAMPTFD